MPAPIGVDGRILRSTDRKLTWSPTAGQAPDAHVAFQAPIPVLSRGRELRSVVRPYDRRTDWWRGRIVKLQGMHSGHGGHDSHDGHGQHQEQEAAASHTGTDPRPR